MGLWDGLRISASGMTAERLRMDVIANNIANANSTRSPEGGAYRRRRVLLAPLIARDSWLSAWASSLRRAMRRTSSGDSGPTASIEAEEPPVMGVRVIGIVEDPTPGRLVYDPSHPDARPDGYVEYPNVEPVREMVDLIGATRAYEANVTAFNATKSMLSKALEIGRA